MTAAYPFLSAYKSGLRLQVKAQPNASRTRIVGVHGDFLKVALMAPPVDGKANAALVDFIAGILSLPRRQVTLIGGETSREKAVLIEGAELEEVRAYLKGLLQ